MRSEASKPYNGTKIPGEARMRHFDPRGEKVYPLDEAAREWGIPKEVLSEEIRLGNLAFVDLPCEGGPWVTRLDMDLYLEASLMGSVC